MNLLSEFGRLQFVEDRDGVVEGKLYAARMLKIYAATARNARLKEHKNGGYYKQYLESALSFRHLLRTRYSSKG